MKKEQIQNGVRNLFISKKMNEYFATEKNQLLKKTIVETSLDFSEFILDIPGLEYLGDVILKTVNTISEWRELNFAYKLCRIAYGIKDISHEKRIKFVDDIEEKAKDSAGNVIVEILDKCDNINKTNIISKLIIARTKEEIEVETFFRLIHVLERIPYTDLEFLQEFKNPNYIDNGVTEILHTAGALLLKETGNEDCNKYSLSQNGRKLLKYGMEFDIDTNIIDKTDNGVKPITDEELDDICK